MFDEAMNKGGVDVDDWNGGGRSRTYKVVHQQPSYLRDSVCIGLRHKHTCSLPEDVSSPARTIYLTSSLRLQVERTKCRKL